MVNGIVTLICNYGEGFIVFMSVVIFVLLLVNGVILSNSSNRIRENLEMDQTIYAINKDYKSIEESEDERLVIKPNAVREFETRFNKACVLHDLLAQLIPIFPLLGILGTVAGLMQIVGLNEGTQAFAKLMEGMGTALGTTLYGLIASIVLKFVDAVFPSRIISSVDVILSDFDKKMDLAKTFEK